MLQRTVVRTAVVSLMLAGGLAAPALAQTEITPPAASVSASTTDGNLPSNTVDNDLGSRWSASGDGAWIRYDLGVSRAVSRISLAAYRGNERRNRFDLQSSNDGATWSLLLTGAMTSGTTTAEEPFDVTVTARYLRYVGHGATLNAGGTSVWNSLTEVSIYAPTAPPPTPTPTSAPSATPTPTVAASPTPTPTPGGQYVEVTPPGASVSASANDGNLPANTVDNSLSTRWSANGDGVWIQFNLGSVRTVGHVSLAAYSGNMRRNRFDLQVSTTGTTWTTLLTGAETSGTTTAEEVHDVPDTPAQYVRYVGHGATLNTGAISTWTSLTEVSIFAQGTPGPTPTPTSTPVAPTPTATPTPVIVTPTPTPTPPGGDVIVRPGDVLNDQTFEWRTGFPNRQDGTYGQYRIEMQAGVSYTFTTANSLGGGNDTFLYLLNAAFQVVAFDDDNGDGNHSLLTFQPPSAGTYYVRLRAYTQGASGTCRLSVAGGTAGNPLLPDLLTLASPMRDARIVIESGRKRLRFSNAVANRGTGPLEVYGVVEADGTTRAYQNVFNDNGTKTTYHVGTFSFDGHAGHNHWHFDDFALYELRNLSGAMVATSDKVTFCLMDVQRYTAETIPGAPANAVYTCANQGISKGWSDVYGYHLEGQWVDITGVADGTYRLVSTADPVLRLHEASRTNNGAQITITISGNTVTVQP